MLRQIFTLILAAGALLTSSLQAQNGPKPLTNDDVVAMVKGGLGESTVISAIGSQDTNFDISATALLQLKKNGVTPRIMDAVLVATKSKTTNAQVPRDALVLKQKVVDNAVAGTPIPPGISLGSTAPSQGQPLVSIVQGSSKQLLPMSHTQIAEAKTKASTLGALASDGSLQQAMAGATQTVASAGMMKGSAKLANTAMMVNPMLTGPMMVGNIFAAHRKQTITAVWALPGQKADVVLRQGQPAFEIHFSDVPGVNADDYEPALLKLEPTANNFRLVGATQAKQDQMQATTADWGMYSSFVEERIGSNSKKVSSGDYQLQPLNTLPAGEYAIALRPINKDKKVSGSGIAQNAGDGLIFNSAWAFEIQQ
jgi:hypothetical protein